MFDAGQTAIVQQQMEELHALHSTLGDDQVAGFYPPEMRSRADRFGLAFTHVDATQLHHGDCSYPFPLQSISNTADDLITTTWTPTRAKTSRCAPRSKIAPADRSRC